MDLTRPLIQVGIAPFSIDRVVEDCVLLVIVSEHVPMFLKHFHGWQIYIRILEMEMLEITYSKLVKISEWSITQ